MAAYTEFSILSVLVYVLYMLLERMCGNNTVCRVKVYLQSPGSIERGILLYMAKKQPFHNSEQDQPK